MTSYVQWLRGFIGNNKTPLVYATGIVCDAPGAILFQRRSDFGASWWGLPGGVLELGENILDALVREVKEETGLHVSATRLVGLYTSPDYDVIYPNGDQVQQITACFVCDVLDGDLDPQTGEIDQLRYFARDALPYMPPWYAAMIDDFIADRREATFRSGSARRAGGVASDTFASIRCAIGGPDPIIIAGANAIIRDGDQVLLQRRGDTGLWNMPGGAIELGERIDQTAIREAREETGLNVEPLRLFGIYSDPGWTVTYPHGDVVQMFIAAFECKAIGGMLHVDGIETIDLHWFPLDDLPVELPERHRIRLKDMVSGQAEAFIR